MAPWHLCWHHFLERRNELLGNMLGKPSAKKSKLVAKCRIKNLRGDKFHVGWKASWWCWTVEDWNARFGAAEMHETVTLPFTVIFRCPMLWTSWTSLEHMLPKGTIFMLGRFWDVVFGWIFIFAIVMIQNTLERSQNVTSVVSAIALDLPKVYWKSALRTGQTKLCLHSATAQTGGDFVLTFALCGSGQL